MIPLPPGLEWKPADPVPQNPPRPLLGVHFWRGPRLELVQWPLKIRFLNRGRLLPWLGPALRGLVAFSLKRSVCHHTPEIRDTLWRYCQGCPKQRLCPMGATFEPPDNLADRGRHQAPRPVVLSPDMHGASESWPGMELGASLLLAGNRAMAQSRLVIETIRTAGQENGLGGDAATFDLDLDGLPTLMALGPIDLPDHPDSDGAGMIPALTIELRSPLFLRRAGGREHLEAPQFLDLFMASFRAVEHLLNSHGLGMGLNMPAFRDAAARVPMRRSGWIPFEQPHHSSRGKSRYALPGVMGGATFGPVPAGFLPWLVWAGRLHAGDMRASGAGGWRVVVE